jgi:hypothetical protein
LRNNALKGSLLLKGSLFGELRGAGSRAATNDPNQMIRRAKKKGHVSVPFFRLAPRETKEQIDYMLKKATPDVLAFRKATNAKPSSPVPRRSKLEGSGVTVSYPAMSVLFPPVECALALVSNVAAASKPWL